MIGSQKSRLPSHRQLPDNMYKTICDHQEITINPSRIAFLKFILEGYDGLAILSTLDAKQGKVLLRFPEGRRGEVISLLNSIDGITFEFD